MSASNKLKWIRALTKLRYMHEELDLVEQLSKAAAGAFQEHYELFCDERDIDLSELNTQHKESIKKAYKGSADSAPQMQSGAIRHTGSYEMELYVASKEVTEQEEELEYVQDTDAIEVHVAFSKLFKKIAIVLHPDKIDSTLSDEEIKERVESFTAANAALVKRKYFLLLDVAEKYNITTPRNYSQQVRWMKKEIAKIENTVSNKKMTYNYLFSEAETGIEKDEVIRKFMFQLFGINIE